MELYKLIHDENALQGFINWLPELQNSEKYYCSLFARKKYSPELIDSNDRTQLKRFTATKDNLIYKIRQLEIPIGNYRLKDRIVPQESLVLYIHPNPRCMKRAAEAMGKKCWDLLRNENFNIHAEALSCIQRSKSQNSPYVMFDIDSKDVDMTFIESVLAPCSYDIIETRGGYHLLVKSKNAYRESYMKGFGFGKMKRKPEVGDKMWHKKLRDHFGEVCDNVGDFMTPIVGTIQGGFVPKFTNQKMLTMEALHRHIKHVAKKNR